MGKIMEAIFCACYLVFTGIIGCMIVRKSRNVKQYLWYGIMTLVLVSGDAFHLVPRILVALHPAGNYTAALGIGKMITSITMTFFYLILYYIYELRYTQSSRTFRIVMIALAAIRIALCLLPQNDWTGAAPVIWGIYRNIPFAVIGILTIVLFFRRKKDPAFRWMWLAVLLSFAFYFPVVLWADVHPMIGMLMMPKTCMYVWIVLMGYRATKRGI